VVEAKGEVAALADTINGMVDTLRAFADEGTRVAREVGHRGPVGRSGKGAGVAGTWKDLTENVNFMADNLTSQVRNIAQVTTAVARGDPVQEDRRRRARRDPGAEEQPSTRWSTSSRVRRRGSRGWRARSAPRVSWAGQARVPGVAGTWQWLTESVNKLAGNLTIQVRAIAGGGHGGDRRVI